MKRAVAVCALVIASAGMASAGTGIATVVKLLEHRYGIHHHGVPALWLAKPFMFGSGVGGLKIAEFESFTIPSEDMGSLAADVDRALGPEWRPFVQVFSKSDREWTKVYAAVTDSEKMRMLVVTSEEDDGVTVVQMELSGDARRAWFDEPVRSARDQARHDRSEER